MRGALHRCAGYLQALRELTRREGALLIVDEVMTGFRVALGGACELYSLDPDLVTLGKIVGGGLPVGVFGGKRKYMDMLAPLGPVYQAGTLSGNPLAMAAGTATVGYLQEHKTRYMRVWSRRRGQWWKALRPRQRRPACR